VERGKVVSRGEGSGEGVDAGSPIRSPIRAGSSLSLFPAKLVLSLSSSVSLSSLLHLAEDMQVLHYAKLLLTNGN
jgi:hypothetical protein